ncbi:S-adenosyl-L-methionine-dependent methyltransferase [Zopfochytrium polystomum]|nr:S-adenosyl-L-methionine-dependent methyltransferase [Zopfochytrium polystomum]
MADRFAEPDYNANDYRDRRPTYNVTLFDHVMRYHRVGSLLAAVPVVTDDAPPPLNNNNNQLDKVAVDVACGTGQACIPLADYCGFKHVLGVEPSEIMRKAAIPHSSVTYVAGSSSDLSAAIAPYVASLGQVDLITSSQAVHWFELPAFFNEAAKVLRSGGTLAFWCYSSATVIGSEAATALLWNWRRVLLKDYRDGRLDHIDDYYADPKFVPPAETFRNVERVVLPSKEHPTSVMHKSLTLADLREYLTTWSAYKAYRNIHPNRVGSEEDPLEQTMRELRGALGVADETATIKLQWPVGLVVAKRR